MTENFFSPKEDEINLVSGKKSTWKLALKRVLIALSAFVFIYLSYTIVKPMDTFGGSAKGEVAKAYVGILLACLAVFYVILRINKKTNSKINLYFILAASFLIRLMYMLYTPYNVRQHDTFTKNNNGHYDYAYYIYENFKLPNREFTEQSVYQFYHPPLYYYVSAIFMRIYGAICFNPSLINSGRALFGSMQIVSCFCTFLITVYAVKTLRLTSLSEKGLYIATVFCCFFPRLIQFSGQINNDVLATLFMVLSIYRLVKWKKQGHKIVDFVLCAVYLGLGMMTKLSAVIISLGMAVYFAVELVNSLKRRENSVDLKNLVLQYALFLLICIPLGLWFQVYAHEVYGLPYNFVFRNLNTKLFVGTRDYVLARSDIYKVEWYDVNNSGTIYTNKLYNILVRFILPIYPPDYLAGVKCNSFENYNILTFVIKSSIFGEFSYSTGDAAALISVIFAYILWFTTIILVVINLIRKRDMSSEFYLFTYLLLSVIVFYLYLQISMPYGCSMDFRYISVSILPLGYLIGKCFDRETAKDGKAASFAKHLLLISMVGFIITSNLFYFAVT